MLSKLQDRKIHNKEKLRLDLKEKNLILLKTQKEHLQFHRIVLLQIKFTAKQLRSTMMSLSHAQLQNHKDLVVSNKISAH